MARSAKPWYRKDRKAWFVTIDGTRHNLGSDRTEAFRQFHTLMREPKNPSKIYFVKSPFDCRLSATPRKEIGRWQRNRRFMSVVVRSVWRAILRSKVIIGS